HPSRAEKSVTRKPPCKVERNDGLTDPYPISNETRSDLANARRRNTTPSGGTGASIPVSRGHARSRCRRLGWGGHPRSRRPRVESPQLPRSLARPAREGASFRDVRRAGTGEVSSPSRLPQSSRGTSRAVEP